MARVRSPNYPSLSLPEAIQKADAIHKREQHLAAPREVIAKHMGYGGVNGSSLKALSALLKYGLLEKTADNKRKLTTLAVHILHPRDQAEKDEAIRIAALRPVLFAEIAAQWKDGTPSDENLKSYLIHKHFGVDAIPEVIRAYRETMELVTPESSGHNPNPTTQKSEDMPAPSVEVAAITAPIAATPPPQISEEEPYRMTLSKGGGLEITARMRTTQDADEVIRAINAWKVLFRPAGQAKRPDEEDEDA